MKPLAEGAANALAAVNGVQFTTGDIYNTIYPASGNSADYAYSVGVKLPLAVGKFACFYGIVYAFTMLTMSTMPKLR